MFGTRAVFFPFVLAADIPTEPMATVLMPKKQKKYISDFVSAVKMLMFGLSIQC